MLSIGYNYEGPTEIGGLVVDPPYRATPDKPGKQLSYVRFLFIAMHRRLFRPKVLAELLPPLLPDGRSLLWEACGKKFTGLTYHEADRLSRQNKEFIKELFPSSDVYASLFPERVQKVLGEVGPNTKGVQRMLERVGFRYVERIDPFDGGPHFEANTSDVTLDPPLPHAQAGRGGLRAGGGRRDGGLRARQRPQPLPQRALQRAAGQPGRVPARQGQGGPGGAGRGEAEHHPLRVGGAGSGLGDAQRLADHGAAAQRRRAA